MDLNLKGRLALVTGSTRGLGKAIAVALAREGVEVIINGRHGEAILKTMREISDNHHVQTWACPVDVTDNEAIKTFFEFGPVAAKGKLDILVNNVGNIEKFGRFDDFSDKEWMRCYDLTFMSAVRFIRAAIPILAASDKGRIINISSIISLEPSQFHHPYVAAKAAINAFTKQMAIELASKDILVNAICLPSLDGDGWGKNKKTPPGRMCTLEEAANTVAFLASNKSGFITGNIIKVDG